MAAGVSLLHEQPWATPTFLSAPTASQPGWLVLTRLGAGVPRAHRVHRRVARPRAGSGGGSGSPRTRPGRPGSACARAGRHPRGGARAWDEPGKSSTGCRRFSAWHRGHQCHRTPAGGPSRSRWVALGGLGAQLAAAIALLGATAGAGIGSARGCCSAAPLCSASTPGPRWCLARRAGWAPLARCW